MNGSYIYADNSVKGVDHLPVKIFLRTSSGTCPLPRQAALTGHDHQRTRKMRFCPDTEFCQNRYSNSTTDNFEFRRMLLVVAQDHFE
jgi:hypothetical protein